MKKKKKAVAPPKDFNLNDLEAFWDTSGKKKIDEVADAAKKIRLYDGN